MIKCTNGKKPGLRISKEGKLIDKKWFYDEKSEKGYYIEKDTTDLLVQKLFNPCYLDEDVTLGDIFKLMYTEIDVMDSIIGNWCKDIVEEGLNGKVTPYDPNEYSSDGIEYLQLSLRPVLDDLEKDGDEELSGLIILDFQGVGFELKEDDPEHLSKKGDRIPFGISFTPSNYLIDLPVVLNSEFSVYSGILRDSRYDIPQGSLFTCKNPEVSLGQILYSIIWELSFNGGPKQRDERLNDIRDSLKKSRTDIKDERS